MKRKVSFLAIILALSILVSCGKPEEAVKNTSSTESTVISSENGVDENKNSSEDSQSGSDNSSENSQSNYGNSDDFSWLDTEDSSNFEVSETDETAEKIVFAKKGLVAPETIYPASTLGAINSTVIYSARLLQEHLKNNYSNERILTDEGTYAKSTNAYIKAYQNGTHRAVSTYVQDQSESNPEILVGDTNRLATSKALELLNARENNANDFVIRVYNDDIAIVGGSNAALETGVRYFIEKYASGDEIALPSDFYCVYRPQYSIKDAKIGDVNLSSYQMVMPYIKSFIDSREVYALQQLFADFTGVDVPVVSEREDRKSTELVIGVEKCDKNGKALGKSEYAVYFKNGKLYVNAYDAATLAFAVNEISKTVKASANAGKNILIDKKFEFSGKSTSGENLYSLTWNDEFDGDTYDSYLKNLSYRSYQVGTMSDYVNGYLVGSVCGLDTFGATVYYSPDQRCMRVENGKLVLEGHKIGDNTFVMPADLRSTYTFTFDYGYIEASVKLPYGPGTFPSFWIAGTVEDNETSLEIDIFEAMGVSDLIQPDAFRYAKVRNNEYMNDTFAIFGETRTIYAHNPAYFTPEGESFHDMFHTVGCERTPDYFAIYYDGNLIDKFDTTTKEAGDLDIFNQFMSVVFSMPVNKWQEVTDESILKWETDYVRLYQLPGVGTISNSLR